MIGDLFDSPWKILIVAVVILVLFGSAKLPGAARSLGKSMRILKAEVKDLHEEEAEPATAGPGIAGPHRRSRRSRRRPQAAAQQAERTAPAAAGDLSSLRRLSQRLAQASPPIGGIRPKRP